MHKSVFTKRVLHVRTELSRDGVPQESRDLQPFIGACSKADERLTAPAQNDSQNIWYLMSVRAQGVYYAEYSVV